MVAIDGKNASADSSDSVPVPSPLLNMNARAFISKIYDMVDDPATDELISWGPMNNSFIVKQELEFKRDLLPKYFKHNNFESFNRQLNSYGFKKVDPDWCEFANESFLRGKKHLLGSIVPRKSANGKNQQPQQTHGQSSTVEASAEVCQFGLEEEVETLKRNRNELLQELGKLRKQQDTVDTQLEAVVQRLHGMKQRHQEMMSILSKAVNSPDFLAQFVQKQNESSRVINEGNKKRRLKPDVVPDDPPVSPADRQNFEPFMNDGSTAMFSCMLLDASHQLETLSDSIFLPPTSLTMDENMVPAIDSLSPDSNFIWDSSSIDEILKSIDPLGEQFPASSPLATDAEEMDSTPTSCTSTDI